MASSHNKINVNVSAVSKTEVVDLEQSQLVLRFSGNSVNCTIVNTLRRISYDLIPTYAFPGEAIKIEKNTSKYNNDMMRLKLSQIGYPGFIFKHPNFKLSTFVLPEPFWKNVDYSDKKRSLHENDKYKIEMYINKTNDGSGIINVTTHDITFYENGTKITYPYKKSPGLILGLNPGEEFKCYAVAQLGIGEVNNIWAAAGNTFYEQIKDDETEYLFTIESAGQINEYEILVKCCEIIRIKLDHIKEIVVRQHDTEENKNSSRLQLILTNEDHTVGQLLNKVFQDHPNVLFSGIAMKDNLVKEILFKIVTKDAKMLETIFECIDYLRELFGKISSDISKLNK
jgi:DNA-directed RNA polymerase subunit L